MRQRRMIVPAGVWLLLALATTPSAQTTSVMPKNVKVLKGLTAKEVRDYMEKMVAPSLGVECEFCHEKGNRASDHKEHKLVARKMMTMMREINERYFKEENQMHGEVVTCFTCHNGTKEPKSTPPPRPARPAQ